MGVKATLNGTRWPDGLDIQTVTRTAWNGVLLVPSAAASACFSAVVSGHRLFVDPFCNGNKIGSLIPKRRLSRVESRGRSGDDRQIKPFLHQVDMSCPVHKSTDAPGYRAKSRRRSAPQTTRCPGGNRAKAGLAGLAAVRR